MMMPCGSRVSGRRVHGRNGRSPATQRHVVKGRTTAVAVVAAAMVVRVTNEPWRAREELGQGARFRGAPHGGQRAGPPDHRRQCLDARRPCEPTACDVPRIEIEHLETVPLDADVNFRGVGEGGMIVAPPTVVNAIEARSHLSACGSMSSTCPRLASWNSLPPRTRAMGDLAATRMTGIAGDQVRTAVFILDR